MKERINFIYIIESIILIFIIIFKFLVMNYISKYNGIVNTIFWIILAIIVLAKCRFYKDNSYLKTYSTRISIICILSTLIIMYSIGIITGFARGRLTYNLLNILSNVIPIVLLILSQEYIRYTISKNINNKKLPLIIFTILIIILNIIIGINYVDLNSSREIFKYICVSLLPLIASESLYSYITYNTSWIPTLIIKIALAIYIYIFPIYPILGDYISAMIGVILPFVTFILIRHGVIYNEKGNLSTRRVGTIMIVMPLLIVTVILGILVSGLLRFKIIAIASNSMKGTYQRGDAVIYDQYKIDDIKKIKTGEILVFEEQGKVVTHRVTKITKENNIYKFKTKGDANNSEDLWIVEDKNILGVVRYKVDYIGYPTVLLSEYFTKNKK